MLLLTARVCGVLFPPLLAVLALGACDGRAGGGPRLSYRLVPTTPPAAAAPADGSSAAEAGRVLAEYRSLWPALARASGSPPGERRRTLAAHLAEPELSRALTAMTAQDGLNRQIYGSDRTRPTVRSVRGELAEVVDCQDATGSGVLDRATGRRLTAGVARNPLVARLRRFGDGHWRVYRLLYTGGLC